MPARRLPRIALSLSGLALFAFSVMQLLTLWDIEPHPVPFVACFVLAVPYVVYGAWWLWRHRED